MPTAAVEQAPSAACDLEGLAIALSTGRPVVLAHVSVGAYAPAVHEAHCPAFVVLGLAGAPLAFAHDAYEAAALALGFDGDRELRATLVECPVPALSDARIAAEALLDRAHHSAFMFRADAWLHHRRGCPKDWQWMRELARGLTFEVLAARP